MSNQISTITSPVTSWVTKSGRQCYAYTDVGALRQPASMRRDNAQTASLKQWKSGQFTPILRELREMLPAMARALIPVSGDKATVSALLRSVSDVALRATTDKTTGLVRELKGHKARMATLISAILAYENERESLKLAGIDDATSDTSDTSATSATTTN